MRIVSLLPSATEIVLALGLGDELVGVTDACEVPGGALAVPVVSRRRSAGPMPPGAGAWALDEDAIGDARPDVLLAGATREVERLAGRLGEVMVVRLDPMSVEGVLNAVSTVAAMTEAEDAGVELVEELRQRLRAVEEVVVGRRERGFAPPRVVALEWLDPPFASGRWVPDQVRLAGGWELLGLAGEPAAETTWEAVRAVDPELLVLMPTGHGLRETIRAFETRTRPAWWGDLLAARDGRVIAVDGDGYFSRPGPRIVDGIELLAELCDPSAFDGMAPPDSWAPVG